MKAMAQAVMEREEDRPEGLDAVIVGAGFAGLYMLYRLNRMGCSARIYDYAPSVFLLRKCFTSRNSQT